MDRDPLARVAVGLMVLAPAIALARAAPDEVAFVARPMQHGMDRRRRPRARTPLLRARRQDAFSVEPLRDARLAHARRGEFKNSNHDGRFLRVDALLDVTVDAHVRVAE